MAHHHGPAPAVPDLGPREVEELAHRLEAQVSENGVQSVLEAIEEALDETVRERESAPRRFPRRGSTHGVDPFFFG